MKPFTVSEMMFKCHSRSSAMPSFIRMPVFSKRDRKSRPHSFSDEIARMSLKASTSEVYSFLVPLPDVVIAIKSKYTQPVI